MTFVWNFLGTVFAFVSIICFTFAAALLLRIMNTATLPPNVVQSVAELSVALDTPIEQILSQVLIIAGVATALLTMVIYVGLLMGSRHQETKDLLEKIARNTRSQF
jgi:hypothetical protein